MIFNNRREAGRRLAVRLTHLKDKKSIVLALPRGGVPVGFEVAKALGVPLDVVVVRKIGAPHNPERGVGAIAENDVLVLDASAIELLKISQEELEWVINKEKNELTHRISLYRNDKSLPSLKNRTAILIDDGLATGATARAAIASVKKLYPKRLIFASPVCSSDEVQELKGFADEIICVTTPVDLEAVALWYVSFSQVTDGEVIELLQCSKKKRLLEKARPYAKRASPLHRRV